MLCRYLCFLTSFQYMELCWVILCCSVRIHLRSITHSNRGVGRICYLLTYIHILVREREEGEKQKRRFVVSLLYAFIG